MKKTVTIMLTVQQARCYVPMLYGKKRNLVCCQVIDDSPAVCSRLVSLHKTGTRKDTCSLCRTCGPLPLSNKLKLSSHDDEEDD